MLFCKDKYLQRGHPSRAAMLILCVFAVMGKAEGSVAREEWHGHVTALSVAPEFRRLGLAAKLMELLEEISEK